MPQQLLPPTAHHVAGTRQGWSWSGTPLARGSRRFGESSLLAFLAKNALGLPSLGHAPSALPGMVGGSGRWQMTYDMSLHTFERPSCSQGSTRTHRRKPFQRARAAESPTPPYVRVSTASARSMCAPSRCKRTRHLTVKRKSRPALCVSTAKRCCCHQDGGRGRVDGRLQEDEGGSSPEDGHVL